MSIFFGVEGGVRNDLVSSGEVGGERVVGEPTVDGPMDPESMDMAGDGAESDKAGGESGEA